MDIKIFLANFRRNKNHPDFGFLEINQKRKGNHG